MEPPLVTGCCVVTSPLVCVCVMAVNSFSVSSLVQLQLESRHSPVTLHPNTGIHRFLQLVLFSFFMCGSFLKLDLRVFHYMKHDGGGEQTLQNLLHLLSRSSFPCIELPPNSQVAANCGTCGKKRRRTGKHNHLKITG